MKKLLLILLLLPTFGLSQRLPKDLQTGAFYIKKESPGAVSVCGESPVNFSITGKRLYIDTYNTHYDLKIIRKGVDRRTTWLAVDKDKNTYLIMGMTIENNFAIMVQPVSKNEPTFIMSTYDLCK